MPEGKHFFIKSKLNDLVLDIEGGSPNAGTRVVTWFQKPDEYDNQLWFEDHLAGTIRSKLDNNLCLDLNDGNQLVVNEYENDKGSQQWLTAGDRVQNRLDAHKVLDIADCNTSEGSTVTAWEPNAGDNQKWCFEHSPARFFHIRSSLHGKVLDIKNANPEHGAKTVMMEREGGAKDSQLWYEDKHGVICSKLNDFVLDASAEGKIRMQKYEPGNTKQLWTFQENRIVNRVEPSQVLHIKGGQKKNGAKLQSHVWRDEDNQKWVLDFV